ncbi:MAG: AEC family transporter [Oscillospiraceae bacterium]|nr:AEC family transporter [Oscillospiraceae bacterium]
MLENLIFSLNTVIPWILIAAVGFLFKRLGLIDDAFLEKGSKLVYFLCLPAMLFANMYTANLNELIDLGFILFTLGWAVFSFGLTWVLCIFFMKEKSAISAFVQGSCRSNIGVLAVPLAFSVLGDSAIMSILALAVLIPTYNIICVILLTLHSQKDNNSVSLKMLLMSIAKNPLIISIVLGITLSLSGIRLPAFISTTVSTLSHITVPLALLCIGAGIVFRGVGDKLKYVLSSSIIKVIVMPALATLAAFLFGFRGYELTIIMLINGVPAAVAGYIMVAQIGGDSAIAANNVMLTTIFSAFTLPVFIFIFRSLGII